jgi:hypothetical protein
VGRLSAVHATLGDMLLPDLSTVQRWPGIDCPSIRFSKLEIHDNNWTSCDLLVDDRKEVQRDRPSGAVAFSSSALIGG